MEDELCVWRLAWTVVAKSSLHHGVLCLLVCVSVKKSDLNVFLWRHLIKLFLRDWWLCHSDITFGVCFGVWSVLFPHRCVFWGWLIAFRIVWIVVFFACCDWVYAMPHTSCILIVFLSVTDNSMSMRSCQRRRVGFFHTVSSFLDVWTHFCVLDVVLFGPFAVVMRWVPQFMLEASFRHVDVCLLPQGSCGIFPPRSVFICRRLVSTRGKFWPNSCVVCCVLCVSRDFSSVLCLFRVCTDFQNTWFPCLVLVWMISHLIPQGCACYRVKLKSMRRTLWWSGKSRHLCWRSWSFIFRFPS